jgi:hypothetical protein
VYPRGLQATAGFQELIIYALSEAHEGPDLPCGVRLRSGAATGSGLSATPTAIGNDCVIASIIAPFRELCRHDGIINDPMTVVASRTIAPGA